MHYVVEILPAGRWPQGQATDRVELVFEDRQRKRFRFHSVAGAAFMLDSSRVVRLVHGDGLRLDDNRIVLVVAAQEDLLEITAADAETLMRLTWHVGNRHLPAQLDGDRLLLRGDHDIGRFLQGLGGILKVVQAPFEPEGGAYDGSGHASGSNGKEQRTHNGTRSEDGLDGATYGNGRAPH